jgi:hypothetical protein
MKRIMFSLGEIVAARVCIEGDNVNYLRAKITNIKKNNRNIEDNIFEVSFFF